MQSGAEIVRPSSSSTITVSSVTTTFLAVAGRIPTAKVAIPRHQQIFLVLLRKFVQPCDWTDTDIGSILREAESLSRKEEAAMPQLTRITFDPEVMGGKPCIRGLRVTVGTVVGLVASGYTTKDILKLYPYLEAEDIREALAYAAWRVEEIDLPMAHS